MLLRLALRAAAAAAAIVLLGPLGSLAQTPPSPPAVAPAKPQAVPNAPPGPAMPIAPDTAGKPADPFGEPTALTAQPMIYLKGSGDWDDAFDTIAKAFKTLRSYVEKAGLKTAGSEMTIFTSTDDNNFQFEAAIPVSEAPKAPPPGNIAVGTSPQGHALKFVHRGSYDALDDTYEAINNYLDAKQLDAKDVVIEQYVTDPIAANQAHMVVNIFIMVK